MEKKNKKLWLKTLKKKKKELTCACVHSSVQLFVTPWTIAPEASLSMGFSQQEYYSGLPFPPPGDLSNPGSNLHLLWLLHYSQADSLSLSHLGSPEFTYKAI